jgi:hypothetical protein
MKNYKMTVVVTVQAEDEDHAYEQALEQLTDGQFTPELKEY